MAHPPSVSTRAVVGAVAALVLLGACGDDSIDGSADTTAAASPSTGASETAVGSAGIVIEDQLAVARTYADLVVAAYDASLASVTDLQAAVHAFLADPTEETLESARQAWIGARDDYGVTEAFRFYDGPIDDAESGPEGQINAWPLDEAYIDYVEGDPAAGIINRADEFPEVTTDVLLAANEQGGETNISTGWHAIEFLLWGQDLSDDGPGERPVTDYTTEANAERRGTYLSLATDLLVADLTSVRDQWDPESGEYRTSFLADPSQAIANMVRGIGALSAGELSGERIAVAYETKDREDEHSCFSDNTNADVAGNARGIEMVYLANFPGIEGPSLSTLVARVDPDLDATLREQLAATRAAIAAFPTTFEAMIAAADGTPERDALLGVLDALDAQSKSLAAVANRLGVSVNFEL